MLASSKFASFSVDDLDRAPPSTATRSGSSHGQDEVGLTSGRHDRVHLRRRTTAGDVHGAQLPRTTSSDRRRLAAAGVNRTLASCRPTSGASSAVGPGSAGSRTWQHLSVVRSKGQPAGSAGAGWSVSAVKLGAYGCPISGLERTKSAVARVAIDVETTAIRERLDADVGTRFEGSRRRTASIRPSAIGPHSHRR